MILCKKCGEPKENHCDGFEAAMPVGCVCSPGEWFDNAVTPICSAYLGNGAQHCGICEHDAACHVTASQEEHSK